MRVIRANRALVEGETLSLLPDDLVPEKLRTIPGFDKAWEDWKALCKRIKKPLTRQTAQSQLKFLSQQSDPVAILRQWISKGYEEFFPLKNKKPNLADPEIKGAKIAFRSFSELMEGLEATFGKPANRKRRIEYYRILSRYSHNELSIVSNTAKRECPYFPVPKVLLEIAAKQTRPNRQSQIQKDPFAHIECECGTWFAVRTRELAKGGFHKCPGAMAKGFRCGKRYSVDQLSGMANP